MAAKEGLKGVLLNSILLFVSPSVLPFVDKVPRQAGRTVPSNVQGASVFTQHLFAFEFRSSKCQEESPNFSSNRGIDA